MAVDKTEPPIKVILGFAALSLGTLVALRVLFVTYFNDMYDAQRHTQIEAMMQQGSALATASRVRAEEARRLGNLDSAIRAVSQGQRPGAISPQASNDTAALAGWTLAPREVPRAAPVPQVINDLQAAPAPVLGAAPAPTPGAGPAPTPGAGPAPTMQPAAAPAPAAPAAAPAHPVAAPAAAPAAH